MALKGETPAKKVGVEMKGKNKWIELLELSTDKRTLAKR
jgi:hypothetical protein